MPNIVCIAGDGPDDIWSYCPSYGAAIAAAALFGLTTLGHVVQAFAYRKPFAMILIMGGLWEVAGYVFRILSIQSQKSSGLYTAQLLLILLAPLWINAYIYMLLGRMIHFFLPKGEDRVFKFRARIITRVFVLFDITAFIVQAMGGSMTSSENSVSTQKTGLHIYTGGVGLQLFFLVIFVALAVGFQRRITTLKQTIGKWGYMDEESQYNPNQTLTSSASVPFQQLRSSSPEPPSVPDLGLTVPLMRIVYTVLALIILRNIYRLAEFASGINSPFVKHEWFAYVFDAIPMFVALVVLNIFYPGKYIQGERADFSVEDKERKTVKKEKKQQKKDEKKMKKAGLGTQYEPLR
jgi:hypothetical protein